MNPRNLQRGAALVEFALVLPLLLVILFGIIEFSIMMYDKAVITNASREAAREWVEFRDSTILGPFPDTTNGIGEVVQNYCSDRLITFSAAVPPVTSVSIADQNNVVKTGLHDVASGHAHPVESGDRLTVRVRYTYNFLFLPGFLESFGPSLVFDATTTMRAE
jgi:Flp pilus assembly protein TadG